MVDEAEINKQVRPEMERLAAQRARIRAKAARWDLDVAVFFFAVVIIVTILVFQGVQLEIVGPAATLGLAMGWLMGWKKGKQVYESFYDEELFKLGKNLVELEREMAEAIEEKVQRMLRERRR